MLKSEQLSNTFKKRRSYYGKRQEAYRPLRKKHSLFCPIRGVGGTPVRLQKGGGDYLLSWRGGGGRRSWLGGHPCPGGSPCPGWRGGIPCPGQDTPSPWKEPGSRDGYPPPPPANKKGPGTKDQGNDWGPEAGVNTSPPPPPPPQC